MCTGQSFGNVRKLTIFGGRAVSWLALPAQITVKIPRPPGAGAGRNCQEDRRPITRCPHGPAPAAGVGRDWEPRPLAPVLPTLMAEGGGTGITPLPVLQSLAQARERWGEEPGERDLGRLHREDHPRRSIQQPRPPRPVHVDRRPGRDHQLRHDRRVWGALDRSGRSAVSLSSHPTSSAHCRSGRAS